MILTPEMNLHFNAAGMLSADGRCKTFDRLANGYVRSEACDLLVGSNSVSNRNLSTCTQVGVIVIIRATGTNQDGRSNGLTAPNGTSQRDLLLSVLTAAQECFSRSSLKVQTHGTGTALGDPIEVTSILSALRKASGICIPKTIFCAEKSYLGHSEAASGIDSLAQVLKDVCD